MSEKTTIRGSGKDFVPCPAGLHRAVGVDVLDPWTEDVPAQFLKPGGPKTRTRTKLVWETDEKMADTGEPMLVSEFYTWSLHEKAKLRKHLEAWRGRKFTEDERQVFDVEKIIGVPCQLHITHRTTEGGTFANVEAVVPMSKGQEPLKPSGKYIRMQDRDPAPEATPDPGQFVATDDDIPF